VDETLLQDSPKRRIDQETGLVQRLAQKLPHFGLTNEFFQKRTIGQINFQVLARPFQADATISPDRLSQVSRQVGGERELAVSLQTPIIASEVIPAAAAFHRERFVSR